MNYNNNQKNNLSEFLNNNYDNRQFGVLVNYYLFQKNITTTMLSQNSGLDRKLISKFIDKNYHPSKETALAVCVGLKLNLSEAEELLRVAGYTFSKSNQRDLIILYALENNIHHIKEINLLLSDVGEKLFRE